MACGREEQQDGLTDREDIPYKSRTQVESPLLFYVIYKISEPFATQRRHPHEQRWSLSGFVANSSRLDGVEIARVAWHASFQPL